MNPYGALRNTLEAPHRLTKKQKPSGEGHLQEPPLNDLSWHGRREDQTYFSPRSRGHSGVLKLKLKLPPRVHEAPLDAPGRSLAAAAGRRSTLRSEFDFPWSNCSTGRRPRHPLHRTFWNTREKTSRKCPHYRCPKLRARPGPVTAYGLAVLYRTQRGGEPHCPYRQFGSGTLVSHLNPDQRDPALRSDGQLRRLD